MISVAALLAASGLPNAEARLLLAHALSASSAWVMAHGDHALQAERAREIGALFARRRAGEPVAYITGEREFYGLPLRVNACVLIPRPETELVVEQVLAVIAGSEAPRVLDLGTGSGAIAVAVARARPDAEVWASDASSDALAIASENAARHGVRLRLVCGDWFSALGAERFQVIASNPPYVADGDPHLDAGDLRAEPQAALLGGPDGLDCVRTIAAGARAHLAPGGWLVLEHGYDQGPACLLLLGQGGYADVADIPDLSGLPRVCKGRFDAAPHPG